MIVDCILVVTSIIFVIVIMLKVPSFFNKRKLEKPEDEYERIASWEIRHHRINEEGWKTFIRTEKKCAGYHICRSFEEVHQRMWYLERNMYLLQQKFEDLSLGRNLTSGDRYGI